MNQKKLIVSTLLCTIVIKSFAFKTVEYTERANMSSSTMRTDGDKTILVNEIMPLNIDQFIDPSWNYGGFIEFYNPTTTVVSLAGFYLSDDPDNLTKWHMPSNIGTVPSRGYKTIWFDHNDKYCMTQANFKLNGEDGGTIYLSDKDGKIIVSQDYPPAYRRCSYARTTDGGSIWSWTGTPTPETTNNNSPFATEQLDCPVVDKEGCVFSGILRAVVSIPSGATLRYTTDGSVPTLKNGHTSVTGIFTIDKSTPLRLRLFKQGFLPSDIKTCSYIYKNKNFCAPIISIVTDDKNINGADYGIFVKGNGHGRSGRGQSDKCNWNMDWDRPVSFEYIPNGKEVKFAQEVNMSAVGGWSRAWAPHSFKLKANKKYGLNYMPYTFFENKPFNKNKTLQIRNGGNDTSCRIIDPCIQTIVMRSGIDVDCQSYKPVFVYINGKLYDKLNMREPNNKDFAYANWGINDDEIDQFEYSCDSAYVQCAGMKDMFNLWYKLSFDAQDDDTYEQIKQIVDIDEFINYFAVEMYLSCSDWLNNGNNVKGYRPTIEGGKFRFTLFDTDSYGGGTFARLENNNWQSLDYIYDIGGSLSAEIELITIWLNMLNNESFRKQFVDAFCLVVGSVFEPNRCKEIINELAEESEAIMIQSGGSPWNSSIDMINTFNSSRQSSMVNSMKTYGRMKLSRTPIITAKFSANIPEAQLRLNDIPVPTGKFSGRLFLPITIKAEAPAGYKFRGWKVANTNSVDNADESDAFFSTESEISLDSNMDIIAVFSELTSDELVATNSVPVRINEVSAGNSIYINDNFKKNDWIELYNTTGHVIDIADMYLSDNVNKPEKYQFQSSSVSTLIEPFGFRVVWCDKEEARDQLHANFKLSNSDGCYVVLTSADKSWADTLQYNTHNGRETFGRYPDGGQQIYVLQRPTIGKSNAFTSYDYHSGIRPEPDPSFVDSSLTSHDNNVDISYSGGYILVKSAGKQEVSVNIYTSTGQLIVTKRLMLNAGLGSLKVDNLQQGVYIVRTKDFNHESLKFIVN